MNRRKIAFAGRKRASKPWEGLLVMLAVLVFSTEGRAQDSHYWTHQYGTRSTLLGGAMIGNVTDISAAYYNPGGLAVIADPQLILGARVYDFTTITVNTRVGEEEVIDTDSEQFKRAPGFFGVRLPLAFLGDHHLAFSTFSRHKFSFEVSERRVNTDEEVAGLTNLAAFLGEASFNQSLNETWYGLTWSHTWGEHAGIGISHFLAIRKQRSSVNVKAEVLTMEDEGLISTQEEAVKFRNYRFVWKLGLAYQRGPIGVGVAITTPSLNLSGTGSSWRNAILFGVDLDGDGAEDPVFDANSQDRLDAFYSSPLSVAVGVTAHLESWAFHVSGEWFNKVPSFDVLRLEAYQGQSSGEVRSPSVTHRLDAVLNGAVGIEKTFSEQFQGFVSFATDFSGAVSGDQNILFLSEWDLFHLTTGTSFSLGQAGFTLGVGYAFGSETEPRSFLLNEVSERNLFFDVPAGTGLTYRRWKFIIGFEYDTN